MRFYVVSIVGIAWTLMASGVYAMTPQESAGVEAYVKIQEAHVEISKYITFYWEGARVPPHRVLTEFISIKCYTDPVKARDIESYAEATMELERQAFLASKGAHTTLAHYSFFNPTLKTNAACPYMLGARASSILITP